MVAQVLRDKKLFTMSFNRGIPQQTILEDSRFNSSGTKITFTPDYQMFGQHNIEDSFQPEESTNIIIYAGEWHIQNYISFLKSVGAVEIYKYRDVDMTWYDYRSCIKMIPLLPQIDVKLMRFNSSLEVLVKNLMDKKWSEEITVEHFDHIYSIIQGGNERADELFLLTKNNQLSADEFNSELEKIKAQTYETFKTEINRI